MPVQLDIHLEDSGSMFWWPVTCPSGRIPSDMIFLSGRCDHQCPFRADRGPAQRPGPSGAAGRCVQALRAEVLIIVPGPLNKHFFRVLSGALPGAQIAETPHSTADMDATADFQDPAARLRPSETAYVQTDRSCLEIL